MIAPDCPWRSARLAMLDVETTGLDPLADRVVEIACVIAERGEIVERKSWLVFPERSIPAEATAIHGISDAMVRGALPFCDVALELLPMLEGGWPCTYHASFDRSFISAEWARLGLASPPPALRHDVQWIDPLTFAREVQRYEKGGKTLGAVAKRLLIMQGDAHRAAADAELAMRVLHVLGKDDRMPVSLGDLLATQKRIAAYQEADFQQWLSKQPPKPKAGGAS